MRRGMDMRIELTESWLSKCAIEYAWKDQSVLESGQFIEEHNMVNAVNGKRRQLHRDIAKRVIMLFAYMVYYYWFKTHHAITASTAM